MEFKTIAFFDTLFEKMMHEARQAETKDEVLEIIRTYHSRIKEAKFSVFDLDFKLDTERLAAEKALLGIYSYLCSNCRKRLRDSIISLSLANAEEVIDNLDIKKYIPERDFPGEANE